MLYAIDDFKNQITANPGETAICPHCESAVIAKCGQIVSWHWAHVADADCDSWSEGETQWHLDWKKIVLPERCEVSIKNHAGNHRADVIGNRGVVIELQNSPISVAVIHEREWFYENMVWLFNAESFRKNFHFRKKDDYTTFRWIYPRKSLWHVEKPLFFDLGDGRIFWAKKIYHETPCGGWGVLVDREEFIEKFMSDHLRFVMVS